MVTMICILMTVSVTFASSAPSSAATSVMAEFGTSREVSYLITTMFLLGYVFGPLFWGPGSELTGRKPIFVLTLTLYTIFHLGQALAQNIQTLLITRFFSGFFAVAPLTNCGGVIADIWSSEGRGPATSLFTASVFLGPVLGPLISGFIIESHVSWRWVFWVMMFFAAGCTLITVPFLPETYAPVILLKKVKRLRKQDPVANKHLYAEHEKQDWSLKMLAMEPILVLVTIYLSIVYGLLYALFQAFPIIFVIRHNFTLSQTGLTFIGIGIGTTIGSIINFLTSRNYTSLITTYRGFPPAEYRLIGGMIGSPILVVGIFWLGWCGEYSAVPWYVSGLSTIVVGCGISLIFMSFLSYLVDTYLMYSASAFAANTICRSAVAAAFPLFTVQMFTKLGVNWACTLIGLISLLFLPSPFLFYKYGARIREKSRFAPCIDLKIKKEIEEEERRAKLDKEDAYPWHRWTRHATRGRHLERCGMKIQPYFPKSHYQTYDASTVSHHSRSLKRELHEDALDFVRTTMRFSEGYDGEHGSFAHIKLYHNGLPFVNSVANAAYYGERLVSFGHSLIDTMKVKFPSSRPSIDAASLIPKLETNLEAEYEPAPQVSSLGWFVMDDNAVALVYALQFKNLSNSVWFEAYVDAHTGKVISATDFVSDASYTATDFRSQLSAKGPSFETFVDPADTIISTSRWHVPDEASAKYSGNNVVVYSYDDFFTNATSPVLNFSTKYDLSQPADSKGNVEAAAVNVFYVANMMHDFTYRYGFTEQSFNFQKDDFGRGGADGDAIVVYIVGKSKTNNAFFSTPTDGQSGTAHFYYFDYAKDLRDTAIDNSIIIHELTHSISNRLTGGGSGRCLQTTEASGMGEGWSDMMADWMAQTSGQTKDFVIEVFFSGMPEGIRSHPYSIDISVNPLMYSSLQSLGEKHGIGQVWANMLHGVYADLVAARGYSNDALTNPNGSGGNTVFMHNMMDGFALQPCNPTCYEGEHGSFAYIKLYHNGLPFVNSVANVAYYGERLVSFGHPFIDTTKDKFRSSRSSIDATSLISKLETNLEAEHEPVPQVPSLGWFAMDDNTVALVHVLQFKNLSSGVWFEAYVDAHTGKVISATDFVSDASYTATDFRSQLSANGPNFETFFDPADTIISISRWHVPNEANTKYSGNNVAVYSYDDFLTNATSPVLNFSTKYDLSQPADSKGNVEAAAVNVFYVANMMHDFTYRYGFTEQSFNFQKDDFGRGGADGDAIVVYIVGKSKTNNAFFSTPTDGQSGTAHFYYFDYAKDLRDTAIDNSIIIHELTHGISNRLTGGSSGRCLQTTGASGMGEGWSDMMADWMAQTSAQTKDFVIGVFLSGIPEGIRYPYSTDISVNPLMYSSLQSLEEKHGIGQVWANMLHGVYADLVVARGYSNNALTNPNGSGGNTAFMHNMMDGFALQPCNPTFIPARDAFIQADQNRYQGVNRCLIWRAFAKRRLGYRADGSYKDNFHVPVDCLDNRSPQ
ncbi:hypothetical protein AN958_12696 [Leucoagaricus sp. SymC.cos]|nr:hypothetical protein AN958_12696 [Leucoagaricus sp. SymC.cos]